MRRRFFTAETQKAQRKRGEDIYLGVLESAGCDETGSCVPMRQCFFTAEAPRRRETCKAQMLLRLCGEWSFRA